MMSPDYKLWHWRPWIGWIVVLLGCLCGSGCRSTTPLSDLVIGPSYRPSNIYRLQPVLPDNLRRVAVLPLTVPLNDTVAEAGRATQQSALQGELVKAKAFECVWITEAQLNQWTGRTRWTAEDTLPPTLLRQVRNATGCEAVLFCRLTHYRPYPPPAIGWNMKLVDCQEVRIWWSVDEAFDAGEASVVNGARRYYQQHLQPTPALSDSYSILKSPRLFGQYTLQAIFATLPTR